MLERAPQLNTSQDQTQEKRPPPLTLVINRDRARQVRTRRQKSALLHAAELWTSERETFPWAGLAEPEPWAEPVDCSELLHQLATLIARYVHLPSGGAQALALYVAHTWSIEWAAASPRLAIVSAYAASGKTTTLNVLAALTPRPLRIARASVNPLLRMIDVAHPTFFFDDADDWLLPNRHLRALIAAGHARGNFYMNPLSHKVESPSLSCFSPCVLALTGWPPNDLARRCITIPLAPPVTSEKLAGFNPVDPPPAFAEARARLARWARDHGASVATASSLSVHGLTSAQCHTWDPLLAIAEQAGEGGVDFAHKAMQMAAHAHDGGPHVHSLLAEIRETFCKSDRLTTEFLLKALLKDQDAPWHHTNANRPLDARGLARYLAPFGIRPRVIRKSDHSLARGYMAADFNGVFKRYLDDTNSIGARGVRTQMTSDVTQILASSGQCDGVTAEQFEFKSGAMHAL